MHNVKQLVKQLFSNLLLKRNNKNISLVSYLGVQLYGFNDQKSTQKLKLGLYEEIEELIFFKTNFLSDDVFLDIGANMGFYTVLASKYVDIVIAFEPINKNVALIELSLAISNSENCLIYQNIVSDQDTEFQFIEVSQSGLSRVVLDGEKNIEKHIKEEYGEALTKISKYKSLTIDSLNLSRVDIVKIDVEGFELKVIAGAMETFKRCRPRIIMIEIVKSAMLLHGDKSEDLITTLKNLGYSPKILFEGGLVDYVGQNIPRDNLFFSLN